MDTILMENIGQYMAVYIAALTGIWKGIPIGLALQLDPLYIGTLTAFGSITSALILYIAGDSFKQFVVKLYGAEKLERKKGKFISWLNKYGTAGLGLVATGIFGPIPPLIIGLVLIDDKRAFMIYMVVGIAAWSYILAYLLTPITTYILAFFYA